MSGQHKSQGFTLIELSISLIVGGLILVGAISAYEIYNERQKMDRMQSLMTDVDQAIQDFAQTEGRLPCPAPNDGSSAGNDYDSEFCSTAHGIIRGGGVYIGKLPAETLGIRNEYMKDIYGNYLVYAVTVAATTDGSATGVIQMIVEGIDEDRASRTYGELTELSRNNEVVYTVVSLGEQGAGAYNHSGNRPIPCDNATKEGQNCNNDRTFIFSLRSDVGGNAQYYDDQLVYKDNVGGLSSLPDVLVGAREGEDFEYTRNDINGQVVELLSDGYVHNAWDIVLANGMGQSSGTQFFEVKAGERIDKQDYQSRNNVRLTDEHGNSVDINTRLVSEDFVFASNPGVIATNGNNYRRELSGGSEGTRGRLSKTFRVYKEK